MSRIQDDINNGVFAGIYLFYGEEAYLREYYTGLLRKALVPEGGEMNLSIWKQEEFDADAFISQAVTMPFFAEHRLLIVQNSGLFKKGGAQAEKLLAFLPSLPAESIVVFSEQETDGRGRLFKYVRSHGSLLECKHLDETRLKAWILQRFAGSGRKIQRSAMDLFMERVGDDMNLISREIGKLVDYTQGRDSILLEDVKALTTEQAETKIFTMIDAISLRQSARALELYRELLTAKEPPIKILVIMGRTFEQLCRVRELREKGMNQTGIAENLGIKSFVVKKSLAQASRFSMDELLRALMLCVQTDEDIKTGRMRDALAVETAIFAITDQSGKSRS